MEKKEKYFDQFFVMFNVFSEQIVMYYVVTFCIDLLSLLSDSMCSLASKINVKSKHTHDK